MLIKPRTDKLNIAEEMAAGGALGRCIVFTSSGRRTYFVTKDNRLESFWTEDIDEIRPGDIFTAIISKTNKATAGYFVNLTEKTVAYLAEKEIGDSPIMCSDENYRGRVCEGDQVLVQIKKTAYKEKRALCTCKINIPESIKDDIIKKGKHSTKYVRIFRGEDYLDEILSKESFIKFISADKESFDFVNERLRDMGIQINNDISVLYNDSSITVSALYGLKAKLEEITAEKVWLKNGGYLFINPTEAMTVIDVNSGKLKGGSDREKNILNVNLAAASEIAFQIKARNLSGIIIVDFINMSELKSRTILIEELKKQLEPLEPAGKFVDITKLGLVEITRQKKRSSIYDIMYKIDKTILM